MEQLNLNRNNEETELNAKINSLFNDLESIYKDLDKELPETESIQRNLENLILFKRRFFNLRRIRIPIFGGYNSGKSTLLNSFIGQKILPVSSLECTKIGIVIRHHDEIDPILIKAKPSEVDNYYVFEEIEPPLARGIKQVKEKLNEVNSIETSNFSEIFYVLKVRISLIENYDLIKSKVEIIDFPGLDSNQTVFLDKGVSPLINFSDMFLFILDRNSLADDNGVQEILEKLNNIVRERKVSEKFDISSSYFIVNKVDEPKSLQIDDEDRLRESIKKIFGEDKNLNIIKCSGKKFFRAFDKSYDPNEFLEYYYEDFRKCERDFLDNYDSFLHFIFQDYHESISNPLNNNNRINLDETKIRAKLNEFGTDFPNNTNFFSFDVENFNRLNQVFGLKDFKQVLDYEHSNINEIFNSIPQKILKIREFMNNKLLIDLNILYENTAFLFKVVDEKINQKFTDNENRQNDLRQLSNEMDEIIKSTKQKLINIDNFIIQIKNDIEELEKTPAENFEDSCKYFMESNENKIKELELGINNELKKFENDLQILESQIVSILNDVGINSFQKDKEIKVEKAMKGSKVAMAVGTGSIVSGLSLFLTGSAFFGPIGVGCACLITGIISGIIYFINKYRSQKREIIKNLKNKCLPNMVSRLETFKSTCVQIIRDIEERLFLEYNSKILAFLDEYKTSNLNANNFKVLKKEFERKKNDLDELYNSL